MGMAASQARYLALVARKSNCEYEGQQINQSRLTLANQSADLFNQMMGLQVPKTPSKSDYTFTVYSFTDGDNTYTMDKWNHLADETDGYNYSVTYHYTTNENVGFQKIKRDPQVQYTGLMPTSTTIPAEEITKIQLALDDMESKQKIRDDKYTDYKTQLVQAGKVFTYQDKISITSATSEKQGDNDYRVTTHGTAPDAYTFTKGSLTEDQKKALDKLVEYGVFKLEDYGNVDDEGICNYANVYYNTETTAFAFATDLAALDPSKTSGATLPIYHFDDTNIPEGATFNSVEAMVNKVTQAETDYKQAEADFQAAQVTYDQLNVPALLGNTKLIPIGTADLDEDTAAAVAKIIQQMQDDGIPTTLTDCFNTLDGTYDATTYIGGLYKFDYTTSTFYTTYYDLYDSAVSGTGVNNIDNQKKMPYYGAQDMDVVKDLSSRALIERDKSGRFTSIRLEDDSLVYTLKAETQTDDIGYEDAMNEATYQKALYDKKVQEINAMTSLIQIQDKDLELRLKQLDTEQNALNTEIDAVSKVVKDNIEKSFKTFGG